ncbi:MAG: GPW/gp25 family protein [Eubacterium sp.]|nr:GPW/gp25 family protein [Eubacterium sp.]MBR6172604.1 GPW/gp25 family protein [Eubacterium sp.]
MADNRFLGTGAKFPLQVDPATGRIMTVSGNRSVKESIYLILMTQITERIVRPDFGSDIMGYAFMDTTNTMMSILRRDLTQTIMQHEPRVSDIRIETEFRSDIGAVIISINYLVAATNNRDNLVFPFYLDRGNDTEEETEIEPLERRYYDDSTTEDDEYWT